jgi:hypothetical protein
MHLERGHSLSGEDGWIVLPSAPHRTTICAVGMVFWLKGSPLPLRRISQPQWGSHKFLLQGSPYCEISWQIGKLDDEAKRL